MGFPKALLRYQGATFLDTLVRLFAERCGQVVVVLGAHADRIGAGTSQPCEFVLNSNFARGMTTSLQCGLRALPPSTGGVLFTLVDHPAVAPATLDSLLHGTGESAAPLLRVPRYQGRRGHPIWFSNGLIPEFLAIPESGAARDVVRAHAGETHFLDIEDPGIVADIDDLDAYRRLTGGPA